MLSALLLHGALVVCVLCCYGRWLDDEAVGDLCAYALAFELLGALALTRYAAATDCVGYASWGTITGPVASFVASLALSFDELSGFFFGLLAVALLACFVLLVEYFEYDAQASSIVLLSAAFSQAALLYFCAFDLLLLIFFWEVISFISFFLVQHWAARLPTYKAGLKVFAISQLGDLPLFGFLVLTLAQLGTSDVAEVLALVPALAFDYLVLGPVLLHLPTLLCTLLGSAVLLKAAQFFFYPWLLDAMEAPVPISAQLHSSTLVVIGFYLFFRFQPLYLLAPVVLGGLAVLGICTVAGASLLGFFQEDGKRLLACSTAGQLGYVVTALGLGLFEEGLALLLFCCCNKAFTFVWFGALMRRHAGLSDFRLIGGTSVLTWPEHAGLAVALANFTVWPGAFSWHVKSLFLLGGVGHPACISGLGLEVLQLTWLFSSLYLWALYVAVFLRPTRAWRVGAQSRGSGWQGRYVGARLHAFAGRAPAVVRWAVPRPVTSLTGAFGALLLVVEATLTWHGSLGCLAWADLRWGGAASAALLSYY
jgi:NADH:ubiquinone oxidoreductase subunit 5 (subunit L)/multisubunit Na+/H+ antiporter MnhA subunit